MQQVQRCEARRGACPCDPQQAGSQCSCRHMHTAGLPDTQRVQATESSQSASASSRLSACCARHSRNCAPLLPLRLLRVRWSHWASTMRRSSHSKQLRERATVPTEMGRLGETSTTHTLSKSGGGSCSTGSHRRCFRRPCKILQRFRRGGAWPAELEAPTGLARRWREASAASAGGRNQVYLTFDCQPSFSSNVAAAVASSSAALHLGSERFASGRLLAERWGMLAGLVAHCPGQQVAKAPMVAECAAVAFEADIAAVPIASQKPKEMYSQQYLVQILGCTRAGESQFGIRRDYRSTGTQATPEA